MIYTHGDQKLNLKLTNNSLEYLEDFDIEEFDRERGKIFKMPKYGKVVLMGLMNHNKDKEVPEEVVSSIIDDSVDDGTFLPLFEHLMSIVTESGYFKSLQLAGETAEVEKK